MLELNVLLMAHLPAGAKLDASDRPALSSADSLRVGAYPDRSDLIAQDELQQGVIWLLEGWAIRYRSLPDGRRQILSFLLPGDVCVAPRLTGLRMDHSIASLTPVQYAELPHADFQRLLESSAPVSHAFQWSDLRELSIQREWTVSVGQRDAISRVAHLLCELMMRLRSRGLGEGDSVAFPPTQSDVAEALGLTAVHVNRMLQLLRKDGLISLNGRELIVHDFDRLALVGMFDPAYLLLDAPTRQVARQPLGRLSSTG